MFFISDSFIRHREVGTSTFKTGKALMINIENKDHIGKNENVTQG